MISLFEFLFVTKYHAIVVERISTRQISIISQRASLPMSRSAGSHLSYVRSQICFFRKCYREMLRSGMGRCCVKNGDRKKDVETYIGGIMLPRNVGNDEKSCFWCLVNQIRQNFDAKTSYGQCCPPGNQSLNPPNFIPHYRVFICFTVRSVFQFCSVCWLSLAL